VRSLEITSATEDATASAAARRRVARNVQIDGGGAAASRGGSETCPLIPFWAGFAARLPGRVAENIFRGLCRLLSLKVSYSQLKSAILR
jgi:hypothetical protein